MEGGEIRESIFYAVNLRNTFLMYHIYSRSKTVLKYSFKEPGICYYKRICGLGITVINQKTQTTFSVSEIKNNNNL